MLNNDQRGVVTPMAIPMIILSVVAVIMTGIAIWSYSQYSDQKNNVSAKIDEAVDLAKGDLRKELQKEFDNMAKSPLKSYRGSVAYGSIEVSYPKTWSAYVEENDAGRIGINGYFHPNFVPSIGSKTAYAMRLELESRSFADVLKIYAGRIEKGEVKSRPIKISGQEGVRIDGEISRDINGVMVLLPLRDKTIKISTESTDFLKDFNNIILENLSFIP